MTTENGLAKLQHARRNIELLRDRVDFIEARVSARALERPEAGPNSWDEAELRALRWALPVLEAEWDQLARLQRNVAGRDWVEPGPWELPPGEIVYCRRADPPWHYKESGNPICSPPGDDLVHPDCLLAWLVDDE